MKTRPRAVLTAASIIHFLHDGFSETVYVFLPLWASEFGLSFAQVGMNQNSPFEGGNAGGRRSGNKVFDPDFSSLTEMISSTIAPDSWDSVGGPASMRAHETTLSLVIRQTQKIHEEIADLRRTPVGTIKTQMRSALQKLRRVLKEP